MMLIGTISGGIRTYCLYVILGWRSNEFQSVGGSNLFFKMTSQIQLAFIKEGPNDEIPRILADINLIPNKVGGQPIWLDFLNPLLPLNCDNCTSECELLLQLYCPNDDYENAYHRMIYLFCCKGPNCQSPITVLRSQLSVENDCYDESGQLKECCQLINDELIDTDVKYCRICACKANNNFDSKDGHYCTQDHLELYSAKVTKVFKTNYGLQEFILFTEEEPSKETALESPLELLEPEEGDDDLIMERETVTGVDKQFLKFQKRIELAPTQILRYNWIDKDTECEGPLFVAEVEEFEVPDCECGAPRKFEFQIMPQLLNYIGDRVDWGTILIYTCSVECSMGNGGYAKEYCKIQQFTTDGIQQPNIQNMIIKE